MTAKRLSQSRLAEEAGVSQSTVCRILQGKGVRNGSARRKLFIYAEIEEEALDEAAGFDAVAAAFREIWDKSDAHADAIARVISSLSGLVPKGRR